MGLLDQVAGMIGLGKKEEAGGGVFGAVTSLIQSNNGLGGLLKKLQSAGLDSTVKSWVGMGPNEPVSGEQLESAIGTDKVAEIAKSTGMEKSQLLGKLSEFLPKIVDKLSPTGQLPSDHSVGGALAALKNLIPH